MSNIYDLANELSRTLRDLPEYKAVVESRKAVDADSEAKNCKLWRNQVKCQRKKCKTR